MVIVIAIIYEQIEGEREREIEFFIPRIELGVLRIHIVLRTLKNGREGERERKRESERERVRERDRKRERERHV